MAATGILELIDTTLKIGLGATISGVVTYVVAKLNHERELIKIGAVRRLDSLEKASERAEQYIMGWRQFASTLGGIYKGPNAPTEGFSDMQWKRIKARDKTMLEAREHLHQVVARLRLVGGNSAADHLIRMNKAIGSFRDPLILQKRLPSVEELRAARDEISSTAKLFHQEMHALYTRMPDRA